VSHVPRKHRIAVGLPVAAHFDPSAHRSPRHRCCVECVCPWNSRVLPRHSGGTHPTAAPESPADIPYRHPPEFAPVPHEYPEMLAGEPQLPPAVRTSPLPAAIAAAFPVWRKAPVWKALPMWQRETAPDRHRWWKKQFGRLGQSLPAVMREKPFLLAYVPAAVHPDPQSNRHVDGNTDTPLPPAVHKQSVPSLCWFASVRKEHGGKGVSRQGAERPVQYPPEWLCRSAGTVVQDCWDSAEWSASWSIPSPFRNCCILSADHSISTSEALAAFSCSSEASKISEISSID